MGKKNPDKMTSDDHYHARVNRFVELAILLISMIVGYEIESSGKQRQWNGMIKSATEAIELLKNREFAVKLLNSFCANKVDESTTNVVSPNENGAWQKEKEELQSLGKELLQRQAILDQEGSSISEAKSKIMAHKNFLKKADDSILEITEKSNLNQDCGHHVVDTGGEQLLEFPQNPASSPSNQKGKNVEGEGSQNIADDIFAEILKDIPLRECRGHLESFLEKNMTDLTMLRKKKVITSNESNKGTNKDDVLTWTPMMDDALVVIEAHPHVNNRATGEHAETATKMRKRKQSSGIDEELRENIDNLGDEYIDIMASPRALPGTPIDIPNSSTNKKAKKSKDDKDGKLIRERFEKFAKTLATGNATYEKINNRAVPMSEKEIWNLLEKIRIDSKLIIDAYLYFINNPEKVKAVLGCPWEKRKEVVEKLVFGSSSH